MSVSVRDAVPAVRLPQMVAISSADSLQPENDTVNLSDVIRQAETEPKNPVNMLAADEIPAAESAGIKDILLQF